MTRACGTGMRWHSTLPSSSPSPWPSLPPLPLSTHPPPPLAFLPPPLLDRSLSPLSLLPLHFSPSPSFSPPFLPSSSSSSPCSYLSPSSLTSLPPSTPPLPTPDASRSSSRLLLLCHYVTCVMSHVTLPKVTLQCVTSFGQVALTPAVCHDEREGGGEEGVKGGWEVGGEG